MGTLVFYIFPLLSPYQFYPIIFGNLVKRRISSKQQSVLNYKYLYIYLYIYIYKYIYYKNYLLIIIYLYNFK